MPTRRAILIGAGGLVAIGGAVLGTGAFTTVEAERTVSVSTAGDRRGFLGLAPVEDSRNGKYANVTDGTLEVRIPDINPDAVSHFPRIFRITNNGTEDVVIYLEEEPGDRDPDDNPIDFVALGSAITASSGSDVDGQSGSGGTGDSDVVDISKQSPPDQSSGYGDIGVLLGPGATLPVGVSIDTSDPTFDEDETLIEGLVIYATREAVGDEAYTA